MYGGPPGGGPPPGPGGWSQQGPGGWQVDVNAYPSGGGGGGGWGGGPPGGPPPPGGPGGPGGWGPPPQQGYGGPPPPGGGGWGGPPPPGGGGGWGGPPGGPPPQGGGWGGPSGPPGGCVSTGAESLEVFVNVTPEVQPTFDRGPNGTFLVGLPPIKVMLQTTCTPPPPNTPGLEPFKPFEEFYVTLPEVQRVVFDPYNRTPPNATATARTHKRGAVIELPPSIGCNAQLKADSPYGTLCLEDYQVVGDYKQKVGETVLNYKLQVDAQLAMDNGAGNMGANRLRIDLDFFYTATLSMGSQGPPPQGPPPSQYGGPGGPPGAGPPCGGPPCGGPPPGPGYGGPPPGYGGGYGGKGGY